MKHVYRMSIARVNTSTCLWLCWICPYLYWTCLFDVYLLLHSICLHVSYSIEYFHMSIEHAHWMSTARFSMSLRLILSWISLYVSYTMEYVYMLIENVHWMSTYCSIEFVYASFPLLNMSVRLFFWAIDILLIAIHIQKTTYTHSQTRAMHAQKIFCPGCLLLFSVCSCACMWMASVVDMGWRWLVGFFKL